MPQKKFIDLNKKRKRQTKHFTIRIVRSAVEKTIFGEPTKYELVIVGSTKPMQPAVQLMIVEGEERWKYINTVAAKGT